MLQTRDYFNSTMDKDQTTTPGTTRPTLYDKCVGSLTSPANQNNKDAGDGAYGLLSLFRGSFKNNVKHRFYFF